MTTAVLAGCVVSLLPWLWRWFNPADDWFILVVSVQVAIYAFLAPLAVNLVETSATKDAYAAVMASVAFTFVVPLYASYAFARDRREPSSSALKHGGSNPSWAVSGGYLRLWAVGTIALAVGYLWVALTSGLLFRRIGHTALAAAQLELSPLELLPYRLFMQVGPWCIAVILLSVRLLRDSQKREYLIAQAALVFTGSVFTLHCVINSRLTTLLAAAFLAGLFADRITAQASVRPLRLLLIAFIALGGAYYLIGIIENVRNEMGNGRTLANVQILVPGALTPTATTERRSDRLNGLGLIVKIRPAVEREGPAYGAAWVAPFVASASAVFPSELGTRLKAAALTTSKSFLLLRYAGEATEDASSSLLTDAYGNLGWIGFVLSGIVIGALLGQAANLFATPVSGWQPIVGLFVFWFLIPFEQEFGNVLYGWLKFLPVVVVGAMLTPIRRAPGQAWGT